MPIYEYECSNCNHRFELKQGFDAEPTESCPSCQGLSRRKFHAPTVIYKGSGFYTTDYARKDPPTPVGDSYDGAPPKGKEGDLLQRAKEKEASQKDD